MGKRGGYGQFCPVAKAAEIVAERWTLLVVRELILGSRRFNVIRKGVPLMSPSLLSKRLVQLVDAGVIQRHDTDSGPEYSPTEAGMALKPIIIALGFWGHRFVQHTIDPADLDPALLMWDVRRGVDGTVVGMKKRKVVRFDLSQIGTGNRRWWLVFDRGDVDLCLTDPGYDVDLTVSAQLRALCEVWIGHQALPQALRTGSIRLAGASPMVLSFSDWFALSRFAGGPTAAHATPEQTTAAQATPVQTM
ncbi:MAG: transcriptional regulator [Myxococcales bacterium]|nr:transcriptional regulator [Myxococcales bacterium]